MRTRIAFGVLAAVLVTFTAPARSAEGTIDPNTQRELAAKVGVCNACHEAGRSKSDVIPVISGQQETYLLKQLRDFRSGDRNFEIMKWMAESLSPDELGPAAAFFAKRNWSAKVTTVAATAAPRGVAVCQACHAANFFGAVQAEGMATPRLAGQSYQYLIEAMNRFADGGRTNNADMVQIMKGISPADREAMARYLSSL